MTRRVGNCTNFRNCKNADNKKEIAMTEIMDKCPVCDSPLYEVPSSSNSLLNKKIITFLFVLTIFGGAWFAWNNFWHEETTFSDGEAILIVPKKLNNVEIQTPVDVALTKEINQLAENSFLKKTIINWYYGKWADQLTINFANARKVKVSENQYPWLYEMVYKASVALDVKMPHTYVVSDGSPNAYVTGVTEPILVIHSSLIVDLMEPEELLFIIGHELGHIKFKHILANEIVGTSFTAIQMIPTETLRSFFTKVLLMSFLKWSRDSEISADRMGMILVGSKEIAGRALIKLISGLKTDFGQIDPKAFIEEQGNKIKYEDFNHFDLIKIPWTHIPVLFKEVTSTHPFIRSRVEALYQYKNSSEYTQLFSLGDNHRVKLKLPPKFD
ncbi:M48 family metallopeptidase [Candidatus Parabeggiatoa sp. HSG14]|uniref:M48 family metallopeptidase n=1 Tax=Candidatus Parabeggiatoa sp. HSG14 TaxID=3055593 RepID=UPI0025A86676|nr:M48 family metallopeptidase [Thiotrichales bacterium HSG14]